MCGKWYQWDSLLLIGHFSKLNDTFERRYKQHKRQMKHLKIIKKMIYSIINISFVFISTQISTLTTKQNNKTNFGYCEY